MRAKNIILKTAAVIFATAAFSTNVCADSEFPDGQAGIIFANADFLTVNFMNGDQYYTFSEPQNVIVTGSGTYTVSIDAKTADEDYETGDFTVTDGTDGFSYAAVEIYNGESLFPGAIITIDSIVLDGVELEINGTSYTSSNDGVSTFVSLYNKWEETVPEGARGVSSNSSGKLFDGSAVGLWKNLTVTFTIREEGTYTPAEEAVSPADSKGSPNTGISDVCVVSGIALISAGAFVISRKRH